MHIDRRKKTIFLGTPAVAAQVLEILLQEALFLKIELVVSQPPARSERGHSQLVPSPVHTLATEKGIPVLTPKRADDPEFLDILRTLSPDLCVTAAYGQWLPPEFLAIPRFGTLNIHPSLLPKYRGAAPVQRALENGESITGVSVLCSVAAMDAGPLLAQTTCPVTEHCKASELLATLFALGARALIAHLPAYFAGKATLAEQNHSQATQAKKIRPEECLLDFTLPAQVLHNKVRAFSEWPTTKAVFFLDGKATDIKILTTRIPVAEECLKPGECFFRGQALVICCGDNTQLEILQLQLPGKKAISAKDFHNGIKGKVLKIAQAKKGGSSA